ncbi:MAG TPA: 3-oxoacyl-ACP reductase family protein [Pedobacter sp.]|jgi:3-oxoacyl-[acyl-carrier protein] reductase
MSLNINNTITPKRVALVTGSTTGLGKSIALSLGQMGFKVAMNYYNNEERATAAFAQFKEAGGEGFLVRADASDAEDVNKMYAQIYEKLGPVDILICNATPDQPQKTIEEYDWDTYQRLINFFVKSPFLLTKACLPHMKQQHWGRIINITSEVFQLGVSPFTAYVAAKGGQVGFSRSLARELAPFGITVNMISPGWIPVERHENDPQEAKDAYLKGIPAGRWGTPGDVAAAVAYYVGEDAGFVTGQSLSVNGGHTVAG